MLTNILIVVITIVIAYFAFNHFNKADTPESGTGNGGGVKSPANTAKTHIP